MKQVSLISVFVVIALVGMLNCPAASAQAKTCSLVLNISTMGQSGEAKPVRNARAYVVRKNTRARIPATLVAGSPRFTRLRAGHYKLTILKRGFATSTQDVDFDCDAMNAKTEVQVSLEPTAGFAESSSNGVPPVRRGVTTVMGADQSSSNGIPPVRRGVTTVIGTETRGGTIEPTEPSRPYPPGTPISGGVLNGKAIVLPKPAYPPIARAAHASGTVVVQVTIDEAGSVISARAISGHPLLQAAAVAAARGAKFSPTKLMGQPVKVAGVITYVFIAQ